VKKIAQNVAQPFMTKLSRSFYHGKSSPKSGLPTSAISKRNIRPVCRQKFAQSGHPAAENNVLVSKKNSFEKLFTKSSNDSDSQVTGANDVPAMQCQPKSATAGTLKTK
jgi:hypothetical protein